MQTQVYDFLKENLSKKDGSFVVLDELYEHLPKTVPVLKHSIEDIKAELKNCRIWSELGIKYEDYRKIPNIAQYKILGCHCGRKHARDVFYGVSFTPVADFHSIECSCYPYKEISTEI